MAKREILAGVADQTIDLFIQDSSSTIGAGLAALAFNSASLVCYYRKGATGAATQLTLATQTVAGAHSDGGFVLINDTTMKGVYRLDLSDTMVATAGMLTIYLYGAANMAPVVAEIEVVSVNKFDAVRMGMTALPNAAAEAAGGLYTRGTGAGQINQAANGQVDANVTHAAGTAWASGAITSSVLAADCIGASQLAADCIGSSELAASAVTEIQTGLATSAGLATVQADTDDIQTRLPAALVSGRMDASAGAITAAALAQFFTVDSTKAYSDAVAGSVVKEIVASPHTIIVQPWSV